MSKKKDKSVEGEKNAHVSASPRGMDFKSFLFGCIFMFAAFYLKDDQNVKHFIATNEHVSAVVSQIQSFFPSETFNVTIHKNGEDFGRQYVVSTGNRNTFMDIAQHLYHGKEITSVQIFDEDGTQMKRAANFPRSGRIYVLINGEAFLMPGIAVGHKRKIGDIELETLSLLPKAFKIPGFLSDAEADALVSEAGAIMDYNARSTVLEATGREVSPTRTSSTAYVSYSDHKHVMQRAWNITKLPLDISHAYPDHRLQVIHYYPNQFFHPHHDGFFSSAAGKEEWFMNGKRNRFITIFIYLNDVEEGGETAFIRWSDYQTFKVDEYHIEEKNICDKAVVRVKPKKGDAILFYNLKVGEHMDGVIEYESLHTGCGVKKGEKWACNVWLYNRPIDTPTAHDTMKNSKLTQDLIQ